MRSIERRVEADLRRTRQAAAAAARRTKAAADHDYATLQARVEAMARVTLSAGQAQVPALLLGATADISVTINPPMTDTTYSAVATLSGGANLLSSVVIVGIIGQGTTNVTVTVRATGILSAGAVVSVIAARHT